ncbi:glycerol-3-phosphate responsive antiterminator [Bacillus mesophilum]|uniref:Glycerol uptake operon antiterminator regulatory protein n=1 Tax=Bacillus mesophilum TaxID=1071718 RepID=A0A7V7RKJ3_9BACI|nr:glycerol-3-phosphate responsive antiterminator [Bacillus mesophilum]KAB2331773.1 glycerol-3-phosphate responsive antiterminator [Bacillus mesophilum]
MTDQQQQFLKNMKEERVIAAIKDPKSLDYFLTRDIHTAFLLMGNISVIKRYVDLLKYHNRLVFLHLEKIPGISQDKEGLRFISKFIKPTGIVATKPSLIKIAKQEGLVAIQRLFLIDSEAVENGLKVSREIKPDALELMPGLLPGIVKDIKEETDIPIITGGLIHYRSQIQDAIEGGAMAASTGKQQLWRVYKSEEKVVLS